VSVKTWEENRILVPDYHTVQRELRLYLAARSVSFRTDGTFPRSEADALFVSRELQTP
jgi:hypothetical protein